MYPVGPGTTVGFDQSFTQFFQIGFEVVAEVDRQRIDRAPVSLGCAPLRIWTNRL